jgi:hypothetical protein
MTRERKQGMRSAAALAAVLAAAAGTACGGGHGPGTESVEELPGSALTVLGSHDALARVVDLEVSADGTVWVLNGTEPFFLAFTPGGAGWVRSYGPRGRGPGEFSAPSMLVAGNHPGDVWVYEASRHVLVRIGDPDDWQEVLLPHDSIPSNTLVSLDDAGILGPRPWFARADGAFLVARARENAYAGPDMWRADLLALEASGGAPRTALPVGEILGDPGGRFGPGRLFEPHPLWARCADGTIALYDPLRNELRRFDGAGHERNPLPLPAEQAARITPERIFDLGYRWEVRHPAPDAPSDSVELRRQVEVQLAWAVADAAGVFPEYSELQCASADVYWLRPFALDEGVLGKGRSWMRIEADGGTRHYRFPDRFEPFRFVWPVVWGVLLGAFDVPYVASLELR